MKIILNRIKVITSFLLVLLFLAGCGTGTDEQNAQSPEKKDMEEIEKNPVVTITMENDETIQLELYPKVAPNTVTNFISLVNQGYYDGLIFHRVIPGFMVQGGDPEGTGMGGPGYSIPGEFSSNGFENSVKHERGVISMARSHDPDSAGSQFFIMVADSPHLDNEYAAFGKVLEGIETLDNIVSVETGAQDRPNEDQVIEKVTVDTFGFEYGEPEKVK